MGYNHLWSTKKLKKPLPKTQKSITANLQYKTLNPRNLSAPRYKKSPAVAGLCAPYAGWS
jgi:hypothetical protein